MKPKMSLANAQQMKDERSSCFYSLYVFVERRF